MIYNVDQAHLLGKNKKKTRIVKIPVYHLYKNRDRLIELKQKQINYFLNENKKIPEKIDEDPTIEEGLTKAEFKEMNSILKKGFPDWTKKEYDIFINDADLYGKKNIDKYVDDITTKTKEEIVKYSKVFWELIDSLPEGQRILKNIERKEKLERQKDHNSRLISKKCENLDKDEYESIKINFPPGNHQSEFTYEDDQYLIFVTNKHGYGNWDDIMRDLKTSEDLLFNYYLKSRNKSEIQKRVDYLVKLIERELGNILPSNADSKEELGKISNSNYNLKKKKNVNQFALNEDYEEEKMNDNNEENMVTDDEEMYRDNNREENTEEKDNTFLGKKRKLSKKKVKA